MLSYNEVRTGMVIEWDGGLYEVLEANFLRMQQRKPVMKVKMRDVLAGKVKETSFQPSDQMEEAEITRMPSRFLYESKGQYWFDEVKNPKNRFFLTADALSGKGRFLKANMEVIAMMWGEKLITIQLPIKMEFRVTSSPPAIKGDTASGGGKQVELETGAKVMVPFFVGEGDMVRVNTETGDYVERVEKA
ncbi:MAG: elongation factor P [Candidatus Paceibacterota bacterium]|jgi:elongation factor P